MDRSSEAARLTAQALAGYLNQRPFEGAEVTRVSRELHAIFVELLCAGPAKPAVPVEQSVQDDYLICLEDGKKLRLLKRYLKAQYGMTPAEYRRKWGLPPDYPMCCPSYSRDRAAKAREIGLGRRSN
ncbi:hypothetical protein CKO28_09040 [Rhodovibrio sodomensis]|uniref:MucR family transcriptional regulator n=1 Tax=Rhodovibrio sodomensis TaxID=1088 RepID=A0ABS1DE18_9PROT|nr:hypothetical protein [Rhodovibrio sodomensis]